MSADDRKSLQDRLMRKVEAMGRSSQGIFDEDVSALVSSYFPSGQPMEETAAIVRGQGLGELRPYLGRTRAGDGTMYVARFEVTGQAMSHVFVVLYFAYRRAPEGSLTLDHVRVYLRSQAM